MGKSEALETALNNKLLSSHEHLKKCVFSPPSCNCSILDIVTILVDQSCDHLGPPIMFVRPLGTANPVHPVRVSQTWPQPGMLLDGSGCGIANS